MQKLLSFLHETADAILHAISRQERCCMRTFRKRSSACNQEQAFWANLPMFCPGYSTAKASLAVISMPSAYMFRFSTQPLILA